MEGHRFRHTNGETDDIPGNEIMLQPNAVMYVGVKSLEMKEPNFIVNILARQTVPLLWNAPSIELSMTVISVYSGR